LTFLTLDHLNVPGTNNGISSFLYVLNCTELYCTILYCTVLYCTAFRGTYARVRVCSCAVLYCYCAVNTAYFLTYHWSIALYFLTPRRCTGYPSGSRHTWRGTWRTSILRLSAAHVQNTVSLRWLMMLPPPQHLGSASHSPEGREGGGKYGAPAPRGATAQILRE